MAETTNLSIRIDRDLKNEAIDASEAIWESSVGNGTNKLTLDEVNAEIAAARTERRARKVQI
ncbi:MAG: hypothetical protein FWE11_03005 [Defluviitaleaceae bacterium]|nr:hypothetical protein [Defluviitaleaceae bacterium]